ncbi:MAG: 5-formyltetrahydrofolate cyclo-ligase [Verrucomicrobiota bacterium]
MTPFEYKHQIRREQLALNRSHAPADRATASEAICERLRNSPLWRKAHTVMLYVPLPDEPDTWPLAAEALASGRLLALPQFVADQNIYRAARVADLDKDLVIGPFKSREAATHCPPVPLNQLDLVLVPGVAFRDDGYRLGRGKGFYDRLLHSVPGLKLGVAFDWQTRDDIPVEAHDQRLSCILTPTRWLEAGHARH